MGPSDIYQDKKTTRRQCRHSQAGSALIVSIMMVMVAFMLSYVGLQLITNSNQASTQQELYTAEAQNVARSGIRDALQWFQAKNVVAEGDATPAVAYPDGAFEPQSSTNPAYSDTMDATIGMVQEYPIAPNGVLWGRYEVPRQGPSPTPYVSLAAHDISAQMIPGDTDGQGNVWSVSSIGYVFANRNPSIPFDQYPNKVLAKTEVTTHFYKLSLVLPADGPAFSSNGASVSLNYNGEAEEGSTGTCSIGVTENVSNIYVASGGVTQGPATLIPAASLAVSEVFPGMSLNQLAGIADNYTPTSLVPTDMGKNLYTLPSGALIFINANSGSGTVTFNATYTFNATNSVLIVDGNLDVEPYADAYFSGFIYVTGTAIIKEPANITGAIIAVNGLELSEPSAGDIAQIIYSTSEIQAAEQVLETYRKNSAETLQETGLPPPGY
jgi:hypothetical protein